MEHSSPRLWTYTPSNSPVALPKEPLFFNSRELVSLRFPEKSHEVVLKGESLHAYCSSFESEQGTVDDLLAEHGGAPMTQRRPFLLLGEMANPYRLQDIGLGPMPIYTVRLTNLCRTYADALDNREVVPGVHHITLARTEGWWEKTHMAMATVDQMKRMVTWLNQGRKGTWKPVRPAEGLLHFETQARDLTRPGQGPANLGFDLGSRSELKLGRSACLSGSCLADAAAHRRKPPQPCTRHLGLRANAAAHRRKPPRRS